MIVKPGGILTVVAAMTVESVAQLCLKIGAGGGPVLLAQPFREYVQRLAVTAGAPFWTVLGVALYILEACLWTLALHALDVSIAFPMGSLCFVGVALLSKVFLREAVDRLRWIGVLFILAGTVLVTL